MKKWGALVLSLLLLMGSFPSISLAAQSKNFDQELNTYLKETSKIRGYEVTKEDIEFALYSYDESLSLDDFDTITELMEFLGQPIAGDLHNLQELYSDYDLNEESLNALLKENGQTIDDYIYEEDLYYAVYLFTEGSILEDDDLMEGDYNDVAPEKLEDVLNVLQKELDLTKEEMDRIEAHFSSIDKELSDPATLERLENIGVRLSAFDEFETVTELSPSQITELVSIYNEISTIFHLKASFTLVKGSNEKPLSFFNLINLDELKNASLKVSLSTTEGRFLADMIITGEMVDSKIVVGTGKELEQSAEAAQEVIEEKKEPNKEKLTNDVLISSTDKVEKIADKKENLSPSNEKNTNKTKEKPKKSLEGEELPETATNYLLTIMLGVVVAMLGFLFYRSVRKA
ncbi:processed acidic surface protein [Priestia aryabhattai]